MCAHVVNVSVYACTLHICIRMYMFPAHILRMYMYSAHMFTQVCVLCTYMFARMCSLPYTHVCVPCTYVFACICTLHVCKHMRVHPSHMYACTYAFACACTLHICIYMHMLLLLLYHICVCIYVVVQLVCACTLQIIMYMHVRICAAQGGSR